MSNRSALERVSEAIGDLGLNIPVIDARHNARFFLGTARLDPERAADFLNNPAYVEPATNRWVPALAATPVGKVFYRGQIWSDRECRRALLYDEIIRPQMLWHWAFAPLVFNLDVFIPIGPFVRGRSGNWQGISALRCLY